MPNMFKSTLASSGGGDGADLIVTCSPSFADSVITCTDGSAYIKTQTCPSSSPYEVTFESIPPGTYTISGAVEGQTFSITKTITDFDALLSDIPDGSTVTPTDDIQIWLHCANIWDQNYTTISQVLADASTLQALIASNNAADYMARSTTWASDVTADQSAMGYIGLNDYCSEALLANTTWCTSICNSTYFENVLNVKVPTMTSNTTPSGEVSSYNYTSATHAYYPWRAFANGTYGWLGANWIQYQFTSKIRLGKVKIWKTGSTIYSQSITIQGSNDNTNFDNLGTFDTSVQTSVKEFAVPNSSSYKIIRVLVWASNANGLFLQFYGRATS